MSSSKQVLFCCKWEMGCVRALGGFLGGHNPNFDGGKFTWAGW